MMNNYSYKIQIVVTIAKSETYSWLSHNHENEYVSYVLYIPASICCAQPWLCQHYQPVSHNRLAAILGLYGYFQIGLLLGIYTYW